MNFLRDQSIDPDRLFKLIVLLNTIDFVYDGISICRATPSHRDLRAGAPLLCQQAGELPGRFTVRSDSCNGFMSATRCEMRLFQRVTTAALLVFLAATAAHAADTVKGFPPQAKPADLVLKNASIVTLDPLQPHAQALAVRDRHIIAVGSDEAIANYIGDDTRVMDLHGAFVSPGFIEGHGHLMQTGRAQMQLNLGKAANWDELVAMVGAAVAKAEPGQWIIGQGWQQAKWNRKPEPAVDGLPLPDKLNAVSPDNPVILNHASGHGIYANAAALKAGGIDRDTPDPDGGEIVHDAEGNPIGMLRDAAENPVWAAYEKHQSDLSPKTRAAQREEALKRAIDNEIRKGVTTFVDMGADFDTIDWLKKQAAKGLPMRLYINVRGESVESLDK